MRRAFTWSALLGAAWLAACTDSPPPPPQEELPPPTWHQDIAPLVQEKCAGCHSAGGIGPFPLETYAQVHAMRDALVGSVKSRTMPPWPPANDCSQYQHDRSLTEAQVERLTRWVAEGGVEGDAATAAPLPGVPQGRLSRVDLELAMPEPYTPQQSPDDYRCFIIDWPYKDAGDVRYISGYIGQPGNKAIVHHVIAFLAAPGDVAGYEALDAAEPGPGYTCFGGPGLRGARSAWLGGWAPGGQGSEFPAGTGLKVEPGSKVILQVHYNTHSTHGTAPAPDRTSMAVKVESSVQKLAVIMPFANPNWPQGDGMLIPAGDSDKMHRFAADVTPFLDRLTNGQLRANAPFTLHGANLHMHTRGKSIRTDIWRGGDSAQSECVLNIPRWDFHWQGDYGLAQPKTVNPGDRLALECRWDNSAPGAQDIRWGEGTHDEMCLGLYFITQ